MFVGLNAFKKEMTDFTERVPRGGHALTRKTGKRLFSDIVRLTPIDSGFTASKWSYSINKIPSNIEIKNPRTNSSYRPAANPLLTTFNAGDILYIFNQVAWIRRLEDGWSKQAARNFVKNATARARYSLQRDFDKLK